MSELKDLSRLLALVDKGAKMAMIMRIIHFLHTGQKLITPKIPDASLAKRGEIYSLSPTTLMLKGSYKNDLKTRLFFKRLVGDHFHFTAFGIDWLNDRWMEGKPPTYHEFAKMWQEEYKKRQSMPVAPKEEWAYINFVQTFIKSSPQASRESVNIAWECERQTHKAHMAAWLKKMNFEFSNI